MSMNILHSYTRVLLATEEPEAGKEAHRVLEILRRDHGHKLAVKLLQLEIMSGDQSPNAEAFFSELCAIFRSVHLIESNYKMVMHYIHHLRGIDEFLSRKALNQFIVQRLACHSIHEWTESAVVTMVWMATTPLEPSNQAAPEEVGSWLDDIHAAWSHSLTGEAANGALVVSRSRSKVAFADPH
jgi:Meiosis protein SPO22/ZIP4 like